MNPLTPEQEAQQREQREQKVKRLAEQILIRQEAQELADSIRRGPLEPFHFRGSLQEAIERFSGEPAWLVKGLIPAEGITLLHGKFSLGKSPFCWTLAQCVSEGLDFFGRKVEQGNVLWVEVDEPLLMSMQRLPKLNPVPQHMRFLEAGGVNIVRTDEQKRQEMREEFEQYKPKLVVLNSLRNIHMLDDKDSATPSIVYNAAKSLFPNTAIVIIHHDKKQRVDENGIAVGESSESFSGSMAWANHAQMALHMRRIADRHVGIDINKSQVCALQKEVLELKLDPDGITWKDVKAATVVDTYLHLQDVPRKMDRYEAIAKATGQGVSTVRRKVKQGLLNLPEITPETAQN